MLIKLSEYFHPQSRRDETHNSARECPTSIPLLVTVQSRCGSVTFLNSGRAPNFTRNFFKDDVIDYNLGAVAICVCLRFSQLQNKAPATDPLNVEELRLQSTPDIFAQLGIESFVSRGCLWS